MVISGLEKFSLIDYPGKASAIIFTFGCNLSCPFCHNPELKKGNWDKMNIFSQDEIYEFMKSRIGKLDALTITGGEPSIHQALPEFIKRIKSLGFLIKLDSNGVNTQKISDILKMNIVDYWAIDIKGDLEIYKRCGYQGEDLDQIKKH